MISVVIDPAGRLINLRVVPSQIDERTALVDGPDWKRLFALAELPFDRFTPTPSMWVPPVYADVRAAWVGCVPREARHQNPGRGCSRGGQPGVFRDRGAMDFLVPIWFGLPPPIPATVAPLLLGGRFTLSTLAALFLNVVGTGVVTPRGEPSTQAVSRITASQVWNGACAQRRGGPPVMPVVGIGRGHEQARVSYFFHGARRGVRGR